MKKTIGKINIRDIRTLVIGEVIIAFILAFVLRGICSVLENDDELFLFKKDTLLVFLSISYQVIFLTTSLLSLLSDKEETVYWERFTEYVLINPRYLNFIGLSTVGFVALIMQTIAYFLSESTWWCGFFYSSFLLGIAAIIYLCYQMSSVYFNREHYVGKIRDQELTPDKLNRLKEFTFVAADKFNGRVVNENMTYLFEKATDENDLISKDAAKGLVAVFEHLYIRNLDSWIINFFEDNLNKIDTSSWLYREIVFWIMEDVSRVELWHAFIDARGDSLEYRKMLSCVKVYIKEVWDSMPIHFKEGNERYLKQAGLYESTETSVEIRHILSKYEPVITSIISFIFLNKLSDEQEELTAVLLETPDPIFCRCSINPVMANSFSDGIIQRIIRMIKDDDYKLLDFILAYDVVVSTMAHPDISWDNERDGAIIASIVDVIEAKDSSNSDLYNAFTEFMVQSVFCTMDVRKKYIMGLAEKVREYGDQESARALIQFASYDHCMDEMFDGISDEDLEESGIGSEAVPADEGDKVEVCYDFTGFWENIRSTVSSSKTDNTELLKVLDDYIDYMKSSGMSGGE